LSTTASPYRKKACGSRGQSPDMGLLSTRQIAHGGTTLPGGHTASLNPGAAP
jgi:hypothetical protein